jgi:hypothetical protein
MQVQKLEEGTHHIRFMPNYFNLQEHLIELPVCSQLIGRTPNKISAFFSYIKKETADKAEPFLIPRKLVDTVKSAMSGNLVLTESGEVLGFNPDIIGYTITTEGRALPVLDSDDQIVSTLYRDIKKLNHTDFFDLKTAYKMTVDVYYVYPDPTKQGFKFKDYKITISSLASPVYDGTEEGKAHVIKMYDGVPKLPEIVDLYKTQITKDIKSDVLLFGEEAKKYYYKNLGNKLTKPGTIEFLGTSAEIEMGEISKGGKDIEIKMTFPDGIHNIDEVALKAERYFDGKISHKEDKLIIINADLKMVGYTLLFSFKNHYEKC